MKALHIADLFCGAGGTSSGAIEAITALGYVPQLTAVNHWPVAIDTHTFNHPDARHLCTSIDDVNPRTLYKPGELNLLWASPECTHHSTARGGKPVNEQSRATAWCVPRWMEAVRPDVVLVENVPEFQKWGPHKNGRTFRAWFESCVSMGYRGEARVLCAADYGDPTTRRRLFVQFVRGRRKPTWPEATHAEDGAGGLRPWVPARDIIDWQIQGQSIYERERPLSPKTIKRIFEGLRKFGLRAFITPGHGEHSKQSPRTHSIDEPLPTVTAGGHLHLVQPFIIAMEHGGRLFNIERPMPTVTTAKGGAMAVANPFLVKLRGTNDAADIGRPAPTVTAGGTHLGLAEPFLIHTAHGGERPARGLNGPVPTVTGNRGDLALCEASLLPQGGGGALRPISAPAPTIHCDGAVALVEPFVVKYNGTAGAKSLDDPLDTVSTHGRFGLVRPVVIFRGERYLLDIRFRMLTPHELAMAQGFHPRYRFAGTKTEQVKQIGNAVPRNLARALVLAALGQRSDVAGMMAAA